MIRYPSDWNSISDPVSLHEIEQAIISTLIHLDCQDLSFSGGLDSTLVLHYMARIFGERNVQAFTIGASDDHPDVVFSRKVAAQYGVEHHVYIPTVAERVAAQRDEDLKGDDAVRLFYQWVATITDQMLACDGIDELMCGYFGHQVASVEEAYYGYIRDLVPGHLAPLDRNSGQVHVHLPYLSERVRNLLFRIPLSEKVDDQQRKKVMVSLAIGKVPQTVIERRKYGFCDALLIKEEGSKHAVASLAG